MSNVNNKRLLLELDKLRRDVNKKIINANVVNLNLNKLKPVVEIVARSRAAYISELMNLANNHQDSDPTLAQLEQLRLKGQEFDELVKAANALEVAIERGYLDTIE